MSIKKITFKSSLEIPQSPSQKQSEHKTQTYTESNEKSYAAKLMIGATALASVVALGVAAYKRHLGGRVTTTVTDIEQGASKPIAMKMNDNAKKIYESVQKNCNGKIEVNVNDEPSKTLREMAEYYTQKEKILTFQKLLKDFETEISTKSIKDLWNLKFSNSDKLTSYRNNPRLLSEYEMAEFNHLKSKDKLIQELIQTRRDTLLKKHLQLKGDNPVNCKHVSEYVYDNEQLNAFELYYDMYPYNSALRAGSKLDPDELQHIKAMDNVFETAPELKENSVVYRAVHCNEILKNQNEFVNSLKEGMIINDKSYVSTSTDIENPQFTQFAYSVIDEGFGALMRIKLPKGTKGVLGGINEYLLPRNTQIKINKIETINGVKIADCEYILPKA